MRTFKHFPVCLLASSMLSFVGCAHQSESQANANVMTQSDLLKQRLEETERINGRLTVRIEELEDQLFLLQDRVDANRIALQRRGMFGQQYARRADAPSPSPETYYQPQPQAQYQGTIRPQKRVTRIPLAQPQGYTYEDQPVIEPQPAATPAALPEEEVVISDAEFQAFVREQDGDAPKKPHTGTRVNGKRVAQPNVTEEKLLTSKQLKRGTPATKKTGLALYKESLNQYRAAQYSDALAGFTAFLNSGPKDDYVDNALYWIGECHFGLGNHASAINFFNRVLAEQPDGNKVPDAMLKMSLALEQTGSGAQATKLLQDLSSNYPATDAGKIGAKKLKERGL